MGLARGPSPHLVIRVAIVDDQAVVRAGLRMILEPPEDIDVVGEAENGRQAIELVRRLDPDVVLMDIRMPVLNGIEATMLLSAEGARARVLVLTTYGLDEYVYDALKAGAVGFLLKTDPPHRLVDAVRTVAEGEALLTPEVTRRLIEQFVGGVRPADQVSALAPLTPREREVLRHVACGESNAEIGRALFIGEGTVKTHVARILNKLGLRDRVQVVVFAYETGLVSPGGAGE